MFWFKSDGHYDYSRTRPRLGALVRLLSHLIRTVPDYTGTVPQTTFSSGLGHHR